MRPRAGSRSWVVIAAACLLPAVQACYEYVPIGTSAPTVGETVTVDITDRGRVELSDRFGPGLAQVEGRLVSLDGNIYVLNVYRVSQINGESTLWSGETTRLSRDYLGTIKDRQFSRTRTTLAAVSAVAAAGLLIGGARLAGAFSGSTADPEPPTKPVNRRMPLIHRPVM